MLEPVRPEFVYLDMGNVIVSFDRDRAFRQMSEVSGATEDAIRGVVMEGGLHEASERGALDWQAFHREFSRRTGTVSDPAVLAHAASDMFALKIDMLPVIAGLERTGCGLGILSNTCGPHWEHLLSLNYSVLPGNFREIILSHEVRAIKPEPDIYALATQRAGVPPDRIFFCDDILAHVEAARVAGWQAELFTSVSGLIDALDRRGLKLGL
ncbi:MAG: HAD family phosphatase [Planctomycetota bacterium]